MSDNAVLAVLEEIVLEGKISSQLEPGQLYAEISKNLLRKASKVLKRKRRSRHRIDYWRKNNESLVIPDR